MNLSRRSWRDSTALLVVASLPLQNQEFANVLVDDYIASTGGWVPDDSSLPTGPGVPASGQSQEQVAEIITTQQYNRIYDINVTANITVSFRLIQNLANDLSDSSVLSTAESISREWLDKQLSTTNVRFISLDHVTGVIETNGFTTVEVRSEIQNVLSTGGRIIDPKAIGLSVARTRFALGNEWNISRVYTEPNQDLVLIVSAYTDTTYVSEDTGAEKRFVIKLDRNTYRVTTGLTLNS